VLFLKINQLSKVNNMYRFSLLYFIRLFLTCLEDGSEKGKLSIARKDTKDKLAEAEAALNQIIFNNIASSLFKADRLTYALYLVKAISNDISEPEWEFFTGIFPLPLENKVVLPQWANFERQEAFNHFAVALPKLAKSVNFNDAEFAVWSKSDEPEKSLPSCCSKLTKFQRLLVVMVFRPEKLQIALINFACESLGISNISGHNLTIRHVAER
jgi:dynein heavy chain 2, cytosolic